MKLVREHISFTQDSDPIQDMGIGLDKVLDSYVKNPMTSRRIYGKFPTDDFYADVAYSLFYDLRELSEKKNKTKKDIEKETLYYDLIEHIFNTNDFYKKLKKDYRIDTFIERALENRDENMLEKLVNLLIKYNMPLYNTDYNMFYPDGPKRRKIFKTLVDEVKKQVTPKKYKKYLNDLVFDAIYEKRFDIVEYLVDKGADLFFSNDKILRNALENNNYEIVGYIVKRLPKHPEISKYL